MRGRLFHGEGDWYEWRQEPSLGAVVHVRVVPGPDGRLGVVELRVAGALTSELLRSIPVGRIEAAANAQLVDIAAVGGPPPIAAHRSRAHWRYATEDQKTRSVNPIEGGWEAAVTAPHRRPQGWRIPSRLRGSTGQGRADEFYAAVAGIYRELAQTSSRPAIVLAEANDVPVTTAHRWIKEARRRGFLGPGRPGKAG